MTRPSPLRSTGARTSSCPVTATSWNWKRCRAGLPVNSYEDGEVKELAEDVFRHVYRVYPRIPSPYYESATT